MRTPKTARLTFSLPDYILREMQAEAARQERSLSWLTVHAWKLAREKIQAYPPAINPPPAPGEARKP